MFSGNAKTINGQLTLVLDGGGVDEPQVVFKNSFKKRWMQRNFAYLVLTHAALEVGWGWGGGRFYPPDFVDNSKTTADIYAKLSVLNPALISRIS